MKSDAGPPRVIDSANTPAHNGPRIKVTLVPRPLLTPDAQKQCNTNMASLRAERAFILEHYFASKSLAVVREAFDNMHPDK
jgi:hypothetical protein